MTIDPLNRTDPLKLRARDLPADTVPVTYCTAHNRQGNPCGAFAVPGATVCRHHGGNAPQVRRKAAMRLNDMIEPALAVMFKIMVDSGAKNGDRLRAVENVLDRAGMPRTVVEQEDPDLSVDVFLTKLQQVHEANMIEGETTDE